MAQPGKAFIGYPLDYTIYSTPGATAVPGTSFDFLGNDEPGLVFKPVIADGAAYFDIRLDTGYSVSHSSPINGICLLGLEEVAFTIQMFCSNDPIFAAGSEVLTWSERSFFSGHRSSTGANMKFFSKVPPNATRRRYYILRIPREAAATFRPWRLLILTGITPEEGISVGAEEGVDDRSVRKYARNGRRVIDPVGILPTFQGQFPWLEEQEYRWFRLVLRRRGATYPWFLALDDVIDSTSIYGGEDGIFYGDMEKGSRLVYSEGCYGFNVAIVSIAP